MPKTLEPTFFRIISFLLLFILIMFDPELGQLYTIMIVVAFFLWFFEKRIDLPISKVGSSWVKSLVTAGIAYVIFLVISGFILGYGGGSLSLVDAARSTSSQVPPLQGSNVLKVVGYGGIIPVAESWVFFGLLLEFLAGGFALLVIHKRVSLKRVTPALVLLCLVVASIFTIFHLRSKSGDLPLLVTFVFGLVSVGLVVKDRELKSAIILHMIANTIAVLLIIGVL